MSRLSVATGAGTDHSPALAFIRSSTAASGATNTVFAWLTITRPGGAPRGLRTCLRRVQSTATVPDDFQAALDAEPAAAEFFENLGSTKRYSFLYRIDDAKRPETRAKRIAEYVALLREGKTLT